ncbi:MAG: GH25 family lysozyme [Bacillota bacterium]|nr:GH25 family lysozyme [Bacillota bacterium]
MTAKSLKHKQQKHNIRVSGSGRSYRRKSSTGKLKLVCITVLILVAALVLRSIFFYIMDANSDSDEEYPVKGIDVSVFQKEIDWQGIEDEGYSFAFIKATEGSSHVDGNFEFNWKEANKTSMRIGAYHFLSFDTPGKTQADNFIKTVDKKWGMLPPAVDVEFYGEYIKQHPENEKVYEVLDVVLDELEEHYGRKPIIYTNLYIYNAYISGRYDDYNIWISDPEIKAELPDGREWTFCQHTFRGTSENVADGGKYVDINVFNGNSHELRKYKGK